MPAHSVPAMLLEKGFGLLGVVCCGGGFRSPPARSTLLLALPLAVCLQVIVREVLIQDVLNGWELAKGERP